MQPLNDPQLSRCSWCNEMSYDIIDCDGDDCDQRLCPNCYEPKTYGNYCDYCTGEYEPQIPRHPDSNMRF